MVEEWEKNKKLIDEKRKEAKKMTEDFEKMTLEREKKQKSENKPNGIMAGLSKLFGKK